MTVARDILVASGAFVASLAVTPMAAAFARRVGMLDHPGPLKPHARAIPYLGGIGVAVGTAIGAIAFHPWLVLPLGIALNLGIADDASPLPPSTRLIGEVAVGIVLASVVATRFPGPLSFALVTLATVALINGANLLDGLDALCASVTLVAAIGFAVILHGDARYLALALGGAVLGFLVFNLPPASVYLGDGGAYFLGAVLAALLAASWGPGGQPRAGIAGIALVTVPLLELAFAVLRRVRARRSPLTGDRDHPYDRLVRRGWSSQLAVTLYALAGLGLVATAIVADRVLGTSFALVCAGGVVVALLVVGFHAGFSAPDAVPPSDRGHA
jgi:UDP-N-acetylmuramyl pentapeptide phosphotransferase/UDP-N-acetylglucosamine-1-phosphate transferase